jgi:hypothetical protein
VCVMISCPVVFLKLAPRSSLESPLAANNTAGEGGCLAPAAVVTDWRALVHRVDLSGGDWKNSAGLKDLCHFEHIEATST